MNNTIKSYRYRYYVLLIVCFVFVSCGAGQRLAGLQADFERLYIAKLEFIDNHKNREAWSSLADIETALKGVSLEARAAAEDKDFQIPTKIALLRLAMIAAWQGSEKNEKYFDGVVDNGVNLCADPEMKEPPTRDCALFLIVPTVRDASLISESKAEELKKAFHGNNNILPARLEDKAVNYFGLLLTVLEDTLTIFSRSKLPVYLSKHSQLLDYYKDELLRYSKRIRKARVYATKIESGQGTITAITDKDEAFAICAEGWVDTVGRIQPNAFPGNLKNAAEECLKILGN